MKNKRAFAITIAALVALISLSCAASQRPLPEGQQRPFPGKMNPKTQIKSLEKQITTWKKQIEQHQGNIKRLRTKIKETEKKIRELKRRK